MFNSTSFFVIWSSLPVTSASRAVSLARRSPACLFFSMASRLPRLPGRLFELGLTLSERGSFVADLLQRVAPGPGRAQRGGECAIGTRISEVGFDRLVRDGR